MKDEQHQFLALVGQPPARLSAEQAAWMLGCQTHDMPILVSSKLLKPLGNPAQNSTKFFATVDILESLKDRTWLAKMTNTIGQHWQKRNARKTGYSLSTGRNGRSAEMEVAESRLH